MSEDKYRGSVSAGHMCERKYKSLDMMQCEVYKCDSKTNDDMTWCSVCCAYVIEKIKVSWHDAVCGLHMW